MGETMTYIYLGAAILFEVSGTLAVKASGGFAKIMPTVFSIACYVLSLLALAMAVKRMDIGVAYAIWCGIGIALITIGGVVLFKETVTPAKLLWLALIAIGCIGLNLCGSH
jgi:small multidrug resistance pump